MLFQFLVNYARKFFKSDFSPNNSSHPISHTNSPPSTTDFHGDSHGYLYKVKITYQEEYGCSLVDVGSLPDRWVLMEMRRSACIIGSSSVSSCILGMIGFAF
ncbi:hypothetical protein RchiOBHm_Chr1g0358251 [Rosa chinensis]|uniref:Uncharacterized protein n=1 Tax=Rosa chinensis TaxID=74649 RepID=A0A2P6SI25_ROSCH|nr:hypothetical protein RchiOBHm_Chr1g0358251 [Rosa chinensis]